MKNVLLCLIGVFLVGIESSIVNYIDIFGISFNLVLIYMTVISLYTDELEVSIIGAIVGLIKDMAIGGIFGVNALVLFSISYGISHLRYKIYKESKITIFVLVLITSLFNSMVNIASVSLVYNSYGIINLVLKGIFIIPLVNSIISVILYSITKNSILKLKED